MSKTEIAGDEQNAWDVVLHGRYIRDLSFENPGAPVTLDKDELRFNVSVRVDSRYLDEFHEVALTVGVTATNGDQIVFIVELTYAGLFELVGLEDEKSRQSFIFCEAPRTLFPWVDRIISDLARDGGLPLMNLSQPDFVSLYEQQLPKTKEI